MRLDLRLKLYGGDAGIAIGAPSPETSARSRYVAKRFRKLVLVTNQI
ncbi:MAG TPA: hypothetical protein G4O11_06125 [Anaerolineae bacterium]|nr:hypothetical protein [Anaerolineae bacterium]